MPLIPNALLSALPRKEYRQLLPRMESVALPFGQVLYTRGERITSVYFPADGAVISLLATLEDHLALEVGLVGSEGMLGVPLVLGVSVSPGEALVQGAGSALRMAHRPFMSSLKESLPLQLALRRYAHLLMVQVTQAAACNRFHTVEARLAKWLLMTRDRVGSPSFRMTHEFMSNMLGVRRSGVTTSARALMKGGLIAYKRGDIMILDARGLEAASCSCYGDLKASEAALQH